MKERGKNFMKIAKVKIRNNIFKMVYCFESDEEIVKELDGGALDFFITDLETAETDRYHLNILKGSNLPVIFDVKTKKVVAEGVKEINVFLEKNKLGSIIDIVELEV